MRLKPLHLRYLLAAVAAGALIALIFFFVSLESTRTLVIATGEVGSLAHTGATRLAEVVARESPNLRIEVLPTTGSTDNMRLLQSREADLAAVQISVLPAPDARLLVYLFPLTYHLIARTDAGITEVADLQGKRVATPPSGAGSFDAFMSLLDHYGLTPDELASLETRPVE
ncbi:MAG: TAXI family TRAP transporter solute-binding subunit, partial [Caldilineaceae bacterium]